MNYIQRFIPTSRVRRCPKCGTQMETWLVRDNDGNEYYCLLCDGLHCEFKTCFVPKPTPKWMKSACKRRIFYLPYFLWTNHLEKEWDAAWETINTAKKDLMVMCSKGVKNKIVAKDDN